VVVREEVLNMVDDKLSSLLGSVAKYLEKAIKARDLFYRGLDEAAYNASIEQQPNLGPDDAKYRFSQSVKGKQLIADNKWHMDQTRTFALTAVRTFSWKRTTDF
jgi:hypothetical protein